MGNGCAVVAMAKFSVCLIVVASIIIAIGAFEADRVKLMPGQPILRNLSQFAGYVTVNEENRRTLFYWFFEALKAPQEKPLLLWLNGGPGCSSIGFGAAVELGPLIVNKDGASLHFNEFTWCKEANLLFLDSPVGTGFSYTNTSLDLTTLDDKFVAKDAFTFLEKWFEMFPNFQGRDFYIAGESYAGHYVPQLAELVHLKNNKRLKTPHINFKGFMVGNPLTSDYYDKIGFYDFAWSHGIISDEEYNKIRKACDFKQPRWNLCNDLMQLVYSYYSLIDIYNINAPRCLLQNNFSSLSKVENIQNHTSSGISSGLDPCYMIPIRLYFNRLDVQSAMHIRNAFMGTWHGCNPNVNDNYNKTVASVLPIYKELITAGYRIWVFSGELDGRVPFIGTRDWVESLRLPLLSAWRPWFITHDSQLSGRVVTYKGLTFVTVRNAGHMVSRDKPRLALYILSSFLSNRTLPARP